MFYTILETHFPSFPCVAIMKNMSDSPKWKTILADFPCQVVVFSKAVHLTWCHVCHLPFQIQFFQVLSGYSIYKQYLT